MEREGEDTHKRRRERASPTRQEMVIGTLALPFGLWSKSDKKEESVYPYVYTSAHSPPLQDRIKHLFEASVSIREAYARL